MAVLRILLCFCTMYMTTKVLLAQNCGRSMGQIYLEVGRRLSHQAILPGYGLLAKCNGTGGFITDWEANVFNQHEGEDRRRRQDDDEEFVRVTFDLQVWRPLLTSNTEIPSERGCYRQVGNYTSGLSVNNQQYRVISPSQRINMSFEPGDVLGFHVKTELVNIESDDNSQNDDLVVCPNPSANLQTEHVWYASNIDPTATFIAISENVHCPSVENDRILDNELQAARFISLNLICLPPVEMDSTTTESDIIFFSSATESATESDNISFRSVTEQESTTEPIIRPQEEFGLIIGIVIALVAVVVLTILLMLTVVVFFFKRRSGKGVSSFTAEHKNPLYSINNYNTLDKSFSTSYTVSGTPLSSAIPTGQAEYSLISDRMDTNTPRSLDPKFTRHEGVYSYIGPDVHLPRTPRENGDVTTSFGHTYQCILPSSDSKDSFGRAGSTEADKYSEVNSVDVFDIAGGYVLTLEQRSAIQVGHYDMQNTQEYNHLKFFEEEKDYWAPASNASELYSQLATKKYREIPRSQVLVLNKLGSGEFGEVCKAVWSISGATKELAVKTLRAELPEEEKVRFLQEAAIMGQFSHPNVVKLYGVVTVGEPIVICLELMNNGDLRSYLCSLNPDKHHPKELGIRFVQFSKQIAAGMSYLARKAFIHRDLAARNVLLDRNLTCKIGDFGMARDLMNDTYYTAKSRGARIPIKWTAPEALLYKKYSIDSDVWSYGMVLVEIWSVGKKPFSQFTNNEVVRQINTGYNQPPPPGCPRAIYKLMVDCWNPAHAKRPPFSQISHYLSTSTDILLQWREEDEAVSVGASKLGASLEEAENLYKDLQDTYLN